MFPKQRTEMLQITDFIRSEGRKKGNREMFKEKQQAEAYMGQLPITDAAPTEKRTYTVGEIQKILGISQSAAYELIKNAEFRVIRIGGRIRINKKSFDAWFDGD